MLKKFKNYLKYKVDWELILGTLIFVLVVLGIGTGLGFLFDWAVKGCVYND